MSIDRQNGHDEGGTAKPLATSRQIEAAMQRATRMAIRRHKLLGESIAISRDGKVVILSPDEIPDFPEDETPDR